MAEVTDKLRDKLHPLKREALYQVIADLNAITERDGQRIVALEEKVYEAGDEVKGARLDGIYAAVEVLKTEARYHDGMAGGTGRSPIGDLYAAAIKDVEREAPQFVDQLL